MIISFGYNNQSLDFYAENVDEEDKLKQFYDKYPSCFMGYGLAYNGVQCLSCRIDDFLKVILQ